MNKYPCNPVGALQERTVGQGVMPVYHLVRMEGQSHSPTFTMSVTVGGVTCEATGRSKKAAKDESARRMLYKLDSASQTPKAKSKDKKKTGFIPETNKEKNETSSHRLCSEFKTEDKKMTEVIPETSREKKGNIGHWLSSLTEAEDKKLTEFIKEIVLEKRETHSNLPPSETEADEKKKTELVPETNKEKMENPGNLLPSGTKIKDLKKRDLNPDNVREKKKENHSHRLSFATKAEVKVKSLNVQDKNNWWDLLKQQSQESGFTVTRIEEKYERSDSSGTKRTEWQVLVQCSTSPVIVTSVTAEESDSLRASNQAAKCIMTHLKYNFSNREL